MRELEARDSTYIAPMAQTKSEILSQGFPSLQISRSSTESPNWLGDCLYCFSISRLAMRHGLLAVPNTGLYKVGIFPGLSHASLSGNGARVAAVKGRSFAYQAGVAQF